MFAVRNEKANLVKFYCMFKNAPRKIIIVFLTALLIGFPTGVFSGNLSTDPLADQFRESVNRVLSHSCLINARVGIRIRSLEKKDVLYERNGDQLFIPASNMKLLTTAAALRNLGPDYRFMTRIYTAGRIRDGVLYGDLYVKGFGDPHLVTEQMWLMANEVKNLPIKRVEGNIFADDTYFDGELRVKTWKKDWGSEAYNAPLGALSFNFNTVTVHVQPGLKNGSRPILIIDPDIDYFKLTNSALTLPFNRRRGRLIINRVAADDHNEIHVSGVIPRNGKRKSYYLNVTDPAQYSVKVFKKNLQQAGVDVAGKALRGKVPEGALLLVEHQSEPLSEIIRGLNKYSNNFMAEQVLKTLGAEVIGAPGTTNKGLRVLREYMKSLGYFPHQYVALDGSGLSRGSRLSPAQIVSVLEDVYKDLSVYPEFITALGVMGLDGSVKKRMQKKKEARIVRVKTGTLNNVSALSGYFQSGDGERFAFSMLMNRLKCSNKHILDLQDKIISKAIHFKRSK